MKKIFTLLPFLFVLLLTGCSEKIMGYSVLLWSNEEYGIPSGDVVPVYIRSNISHVYVIGTPSGEKVELPLWQLTDPVKKSKIQAVQDTYSEYANTYASVKVDGLPGRAEYVNTSKQVYRFRKGEVVKILYQGNGQPPMTGDKPLEGEWYKFLTKTGVQGWCFSYSLNLYKAGLDRLPLDGELDIEQEENDGVIDAIAEKIWYPDYFRKMIDSKNIDTSAISPAYNFKIDKANNKVSLNTQKLHLSWPYAGYVKVDTNDYELIDIPIHVLSINGSEIVVRYTGANGKPEDLNFLTIKEDLNQILSEERTRRSKQLAKFTNNGPTYSSAAYGTIRFNSDNSIKWENYQALVPAIIKAGAQNSGVASIKCSVGSKLSANYDGVVTIRLNGLDSDINFLYKFEKGGVRLEDTSSAVYDGSQIIERSQSPVIMFFKAN